MKQRVFIPALAACSLAGWFAPSLWEKEEPPRATRRIPAQAAPPPSAQAFAARVKNAGSMMAQFQAIAAGAAGPARSLAAASAAHNLPGFSCEDTEQLALRLAGEELAKGVTDGAAFVRSLKALDWEARSGALQAWAANDPAGALRGLMTPAGLALDGGDQALMENLVEKDSTTALRLLRSSTGTAEEMERGWAALLSVFAKKDPALALDTLRAAPWSTRKKGVESILETLSKRDPRAALQWRETLPPEFRGFAEPVAVLREWADKDPAGLATVWKDHHKEMEASEFAGKWAKIDPEAAITWAIESDDCEDEVPFVTEGISTLARRDPAKAQEALALLEGDDREQGVRNLATNWGPVDFPAALTWAKALTDPKEKETALGALSGTAANLTAEDRRAFIAEAGEHTSVGFQVLWSLDRQEALKGFASLPAEEQSKAWGSLADEIIRASPEAASHLPLPDDITAGEVRPKIAAQWAQQDVAATAQWVRSLEAGDPQKLAAQNLIAVWNRNEPEAAEAWTKSLPEGAMKDAAFDQLAAAAFASSDQNAAMRWFLLQGDAELRLDSLHVIYEKWAELDPAAAQTAVKALPLSAEEKEQVISRVRKADEEELPTPDEQ